ncbi:hypothetical protein GWI33_002345, partial [Rhynchophorus ferrugineus]
MGWVGLVLPHDLPYFPAGEGRKWLTKKPSGRSGRGLSSTGTQRHFGSYFGRGPGGWPREPTTSRVRPELSANPRRARHHPPPPPSFASERRRFIEFLIW